MSHNVGYRSYDENVNKDKVKAEIDHYVAMEDWQEGCSGLWHGIRWIDKTFPSYEDAQKYIESADRGNYDNLAVKYRVPDSGYRNNPKYIELQKRSARLWEEFEAMDKVRYMDSVKSGLVTCRGCGSKISSKAWKYNTCPVCRTDFRSKTMLDRIQAKREAWDKVRESQREFVAKYAEKHSTISWLVKFEYHT